MKKWFKFFWLSFFSNETSKDGARRGFSNFFLALILSLVILCAGFIGADILPFNKHYSDANGFSATARKVFANENEDKSISLFIENDKVKAKKSGGQYSNELFVNTFINAQDKLDYSVDGYDVVVDMRPANALAEVEVYCVSTADKTNKITYEEYLTLNDVAKLNFEFALKYTGNELVLTDGFVAECKKTVDEMSSDNKLATDKLGYDLAENRITKDEYNRAIYELYFSKYYPEIKKFETSSKVPLLRNFYHHEYISGGKTKFLFVFNDYMVGSFETKSGIDVVFYGIYNDVENGVLVDTNDAISLQQKTVDEFIKNAYSAVPRMSLYIYIMNIVRLLPYIALMPVVVALLVHSILRLKTAQALRTFGGTFKIVGSYVWFSSVIASIFAIILSFFVSRNILSILPLVCLFVVLMVRSIIFMIWEIKKNKQLIEKEMAEASQINDSVEV